MLIKQVEGYVQHQKLIGNVWYLVWLRWDPDKARYVPHPNYAHLV